jgi:hypothetical protein
MEYSHVFFDYNLTDIDCNKNKNELCFNNECKKCFEKSFSNHALSNYWSEKNNILPRNVLRGKDKKFLFDCECGHEFYIKLSHILEHKWCSYCSNPPKKLCEDDDCESCFNKSFASHKNVQNWSVENILNPRQVFKQSKKIVKFKCLVCKHSYEKKVSNNECSYCGSKQLCEDDDCTFCFNKSFASHERSKYWSSENIFTPRQVFKNSNIKYKFKGECGHEFIIKPLDINHGNNWCGICCLKTEKIVFDFVKELYPSTIHQYRADWCKNTETNYYLPFDMFVIELNIIIEIDGIQHFEYVKFFNNNVDKNKNRDVYKAKLALENGLSVIRINQEDIWKNKIDWKELLKIKLIEKNITPTIHYICKNEDSYDDHKSLIKE